MKEQLKVYSVALVGFASTTFQNLFDLAEPLLKLLLLVGQVGVAAATILYILAKWRNARRNKRIK